MKKIALLTLMLSCTFLFGQNDTNGKVKFNRKTSSEILSPCGHERCSSNENEELLRSENPNRMNTQQFETWLAPHIQRYKETAASRSESGGIIYIPVVVHVIHNGDAYGVNENILDEQVQSQITVMNEDFRRMVGTPGFNTNPLGVDTQIEFVLAKVDPNGNPTNGIDRVNLCRENYKLGSNAQIITLVNTEVKPATIWDPTQYMNMWSINWDGASLLGYAQFPDGSGLGGLNATYPTASTDGVVSGYKFFGSRTIFPGGNYGTGTAYDKGRTMTHEVGHYLGLRHIWGDNGCSGTENLSTNEDFCADTPAAGSANFGCPAGANTCPNVPGNDMVENYMDYTDDACMNIFTNDQKTRMMTVLNVSPRRTSLKTSTKDLAIPLFANDAEVVVDRLCVTAVASCDNPNGGFPLKKVTIYNRGTSNLTAATLSYNIDGGTNYTHNWTGNLAPHRSAEITLANTLGSGTLNVSITSANGGADERASNNVASKTFTGTSSGPIAYYNYTTFTFNLVGDRYGTETRWSLKDAAGTILYSGGPYGNGSSDTTQNFVTNQIWNLPANGCYYLTVTDSDGDGINAGFGAGYYTVTANSGAVSVVNNTNFTTSSAVHYFTNNSNLSAENFEESNEISVFPNPATNELNIMFAKGFNGAFKYSIFNSLGQEVKQAKVTSQADMKINTSNFSNGIYFIKIEKEGKVETIKFVKQ